jgi:molybdopterin converting factor small subunit
VASVTVLLPSLLVDVSGCGPELPLEAATLADALERLTELHPALRVHLFDEGGRFRQHVLCFHNDVNTRWRRDLSATLADGDTIRILQAVSGG